jgi:hypothetical protein
MNNFLAPDSQCSLHLAYLFRENADIGTKTTARRASLLTNTNHKAQFFFPTVQSTGSLSVSFWVPFSSK